MSGAVVSKTRTRRRGLDGRPSDDNYPTHPIATHALLSREPFEGSIWECCAGEGVMASTLRQAGHDVVATTLIDYGGTHVTPARDVLLERRLLAPNIVTNPPFALCGRAAPLIRHLLDLEPKKLALLLPLTVLEGQKRLVGLYDRRPPTRIWVFSGRVTMIPDMVASRERGAKTVSGVTAYAWLVWDWPYTERPRLDWIGGAA